jgi:hypothetical protein
MSKKTIYILISILVLSGIITGGYFIYKNQNNQSNLIIEEGEYKEFSPFGTSVNSISSINKNQSSVKQNERFYRLTESAISGATFFQDKKILDTKTIYQENKTISEIPSVRYTERATGHIYNINLKNGQSQIMSDSTIPAIYESFFNRSASSVLYRYLSNDRKTISSFLSTMGESGGEFLEENIINVSLSSDKNNFFYLVKTNNGVIGFIKSFNSIDKREVFTSPFSEWISQWANEEKIYLTTKPSYLYKGSLFEYNIKTKKIEKILGGILGLTSLSNNDGTKILFNEVAEYGSVLKILDTKTKEIKETNIYGLPEKCIWSINNIDVYCATPNNKVGEVPDIWYQGLLSFNDSFIKINGDTGFSSNILNSEEITPVDAINLFLSENENQLFFTNKKDYTLWSLILN